ncbi:ABC transporter ATP-binding protein [Novosphingobium sp.]|uniref:ABC transporter ATP-binding protein n=1 Tax=Novosphingobium sp. TaxID=1874826 RepID=UPI00352AE8EF
MLAAKQVSVPGRLEAITTALRPSQITAICGPNGAGKSTLLACLAGLHARTEGVVLLDGHPVAALPPLTRARAIGFLPQDGAVAWDVTVETLVRLGRLPHRAGPEADAAAARAAMAALDLEGFAARPVSALSGGERARALLARVLAGEPRWILADEPLASLDLAHQLALLARFRILAGGGAGVVLVLHDLAQAMNHADRVLILDQGRLVADGPPETTLTPAMIGEVWGLDGHWLGEPGRRALAFSPS